MRGLETRRFGARRPQAGIPSNAYGALVSDGPLGTDDAGRVTDSLGIRILGPSVSVASASDPANPGGTKKTGAPPETDAAAARRAPSATDSPRAPASYSKGPGGAPGRPRYDVDPKAVWSAKTAALTPQVFEAVTPHGGRCVFVPSGRGTAEPLKRAGAQGEFEAVMPWGSRANPNRDAVACFSMAGDGAQSAVDWIVATHQYRGDTGPLSGLAQLPGEVQSALGALFSPAGRSALAGDAAQQAEYRSLLLDAGFAAPDAARMLADILSWPAPDAGGARPGVWAVLNLAVAYMHRQAQAESGRLVFSMAVVAEGQAYLLSAGNRPVWAMRGDDMVGTPVQTAGEVLRRKSQSFEVNPRFDKALCGPVLGAVDRPPGADARPGRGLERRCFPVRGGEAILLNVPAANYLPELRAAGDLEKRQEAEAVENGPKLPRRTVSLLELMETAEPAPLPWTLESRLAAALREAQVDLGSATELSSHFAALDPKRHRADDGNAIVFRVAPEQPA